MADTLAFEDTSTDCAICLEPLAGNRRVITLSCGHCWHFDCIVEQLKTAQPQATKRLLFTGCQCAKCGTICDHPDLANLTRSTDVLRAKVDVLLREQVALDAPQIWKQAKETSPQAEQLVIEEARRRYAFYLCGHCREPYFGGTVECADQVETDLPNGNEVSTNSSDERLCVACSPQSQVVCQNPLEHRGYLVWKCRYCCRPSTHLCYGNVHFCDECHFRNGIQAHTAAPEGDRQRHEPFRRRHRPIVEPIPCMGNACTFPKLHGQMHHSNGSTLSSEQVYYCALCQSSSNHPAGLGEPGSRNFVSNPSGEKCLQMWRQQSPGMSWQVEPSELQVNASTTTNFVSSYSQCVMSQTVDLTKYLLPTTSPTTTFRVEVAARYMARTDCPSVFRLKGQLFDERRQLVERVVTPTYDAPPDFWGRASLILDNVSLERARYVDITVAGKDSRFWRGLFGSKVADCTIRILGTPDEIRGLVRESGRDADNTTTVNNHAGQGAVPRAAVPGDDAPEERHLPRQFVPILRDAVLPAVCFVALAWLLKES